MSSLTLTKIQIILLTTAAKHPDGLVVMPERMSETAAAKHLAMFESLKLISLTENAGDTIPHLAPSGYRAIGLTPPRRSTRGRTLVRGSKRDLLAGMLDRDGGATIPELMSATGWLPHTTRSALSRIRSGGQTLVKIARADGATAYTVKLEQPAPEAQSGQPEPDALTSATL